MPKDFPRSRRIAEQIQRELSDIIRLELKDPRVGMVTITDVEVSQDHTHAKVFFTLLGEHAEAEATERGVRLSQLIDAAVSDDPASPSKK